MLALSEGRSRKQSYGVTNDWCKQSVKIGCCHQLSSDLLKTAKIFQYIKLKYHPTSNSCVPTNL